MRFDKVIYKFISIYYTNIKFFKWHNNCDNNRNKEIKIYNISNISNKIYLKANISKLKKTNIKITVFKLFQNLYKLIK